MTNVVAAIVVALLAGGSLWLARTPADGGSAESRRRRVNRFLQFCVAASFLAGLSQHDLFPFSAWQLISGRFPTISTSVRLLGVDALGREHDIDYRAWEPLSWDELTAWVDRDLMELPPEARERAARYLLAWSEAARARARAGGGVGTLDRYLGPVAAPFFLLHPARWSDPAAVPSSPFVVLRVYRESWNVVVRAARRGPVHRRLLYETRSP